MIFFLLKIREGKGNLGREMSGNGAPESEHERVLVIPEHIQGILTMNQQNCHMIALK